MTRGWPAKPPKKALEVARTAGIPSALASALASFPGLCSAKNPSVRSTSSTKPSRSAPRSAIPSVSSSPLQGKGMYHVFHGDWDLALNQVRDAIERVTRGGTGTGVMVPTVGVAAVALTGLGHFEPGATFLGAARHLGPGRTYGWAEQLIAHAETILIDQLGQSRYDALTAQGAELTSDDAITTLTTTLADIP